MIDEAQTGQMVDFAMGQGVNYYDTAWGYHDGQSEIALGRALRAQRLLLIPEESWSPPVLRRAWLHAGRMGRPMALQTT